jgi:glycerol kinase
VLFDALGNVLRKASREHRQHYPQPGWVEHDAEEIWQHALSVLGEFGDVDGLSITNQRETIVIFARDSGRPLHPAIVWQCQRGAELCATLQARNEAVQCKTGLPIDPYFSASKLLWLMRERPDLKIKLQSGEALIGTIDTYLIYRLTEGRVFATDHTNASRTLLFDIKSLCWDAELCALFEVPIQALAEVRSSNAGFGETNAGGIFPKLIPIRGVIGDSQASLFAQHCFAPKMAKATFGTGTFVLVNQGVACPESGMTTLAWTIDAIPTYASERAISYSAATLTWLKNQLGLLESNEEAEQLALSVPSSEGVYFVPNFGTGAAILGMTTFTTRAHIIRAALEAIAFQVCDALESLGGKSTVLHADGGLTKNAFLMQCVADLIQIELRVSDVAESSPLGAVMLGFLGNELPYRSKNYAPQILPNQAEQRKAGWQAASKRLQ